MPVVVLICGSAPSNTKLAVASALARRLADDAKFTVETSAVFDVAEEKGLLSSRVGSVLLAVDDESGAAREDYFYHVRVLLVAGATPEMVASDAAEVLQSGGVTSYVSTRGGTKDKPLTFLDVVRVGLAPDGGLYVPSPMPSTLPSPTLRYMCTDEFPDSYSYCAQIILERLIDRSQVPPGLLHSMISTAYPPEAWGGSANCCPVTDVTFPSANQANITVHLSEQFHGPTSAFKDFALQLFPQFFDLSTTTTTTVDSTGNYLVLTATSGDTGSAAISGFIRGSPHIKVMVLYPTFGVSPVQRIQMLSMHGSNVNVVAVDGDFDFCQATVKQIFNDTAIKQQLQDSCGVRLSSANSINWGRLVPQIVYYFWCYASLVRKGQLPYGDPMDVCVPTGNFGNILACFLAKHMGLPVGRLVLASNVNDVLCDFVNTGTYDISARHLQLTASPSIDILRASNVERFLYFCSGADSGLVASLMERLNTEKKFTVPPNIREVLQTSFWGGMCSEADCRTAIRFTNDACHVLLDPHSAVAMHVARRYVEDAPGPKARCLLVASTAHWSKFPEPVAEALGAVPDAGSKGNGASADQVRALFESIIRAAPHASISRPLSAIFAAPSLNEAGPRVPATIEAVLQNLMQFARS